MHKDLMEHKNQLREFNSTKQELDANLVLIKQKNTILRQITAESNFLREQQVMLLNLVGQADQTKIDEYESISHETRMRYIQEEGQAIE